MIYYICVEEVSIHCTCVGEVATHYTCGEEVKLNAWCGVVGTWSPERVLGRRSVYWVVLAEKRSDPCLVSGERQSGCCFVALGKQNGCLHVFEAGSESDCKDGGEAVSYRGIGEGEKVSDVARHGVLDWENESTVSWVEEKQIENHALVHVETASATSAAFAQEASENEI